MNYCRVAQSVLAFAIFLSNFSVSAASTIGTYTYPGSGEEKKFMDWSLKDVDLNQNSKSLSIKFTLPDNATGGKKISIHFSGEISETGFFQMNGQNGTASCLKGKELYTCIMKLKDLGLDPVTTKNFLRKKFPDNYEYESRLKVAMAYAAEPVGIAVFQVK